MLQDLKIALVFLTRLPVRVDQPIAVRELGSAVHLFAAVGAIVGIGMALALASALALGVPALVAATLAVAAGALLTGALHEDGLADTADALGVADRDRALEVMRDSRIGSFGAIALICTLVGRIGAIAALAQVERAAAGVIAAAAVSRSFMPCVMRLQRAARASGLAASVGRPDAGRVVLGLMLAAGLTLVLLAPLAAAAAFATSAILAGIVALALGRRFGGCTGDTLGAVQQVGELAFLAALAAASR